MIMKDLTLFLDPMIMKDLTLFLLFLFFTLAAMDIIRGWVERHRNPLRLEKCGLH